MNKRTIITDNTEPPKNYLWHKLSPAGLDLGVYEYRDGKWNKIETGVSGSETEETNFDNIITGFYKGDRDWDSTYTYEEYKLTNDVSNLIKKESNGIYAVNRNKINQVNGSYIIATTNIDDIVFVGYYWTHFNDCDHLFLIPDRKGDNTIPVYNLSTYTILIKHNSEL